MPGKLDNMETGPTIKTRAFLRQLLALGLLLVPALAAAATLYKSVGSDGRVTYSDRPPTQGKVEKTLTFKNLPASPLPESVIRYRKDLLESAQRRGARPPAANHIQLFSAAWCGYCSQAKAYLAARNIAYQEHDIDTPEGQRAFGQAGNHSGIPLLLVQGQQVQGFSKPAYDALFTR